MRYFFVLLLITTFLYSCDDNEPDCPDTQAYDFKLSLTRVLDSVTTRLKVYNPELQDSLNIDENFPTLMSIPVNVTQDSTIFYIDFINDTTGVTITDTIAFTYTKDVTSAGEDCGFVMSFIMQKVFVSKNNIDSLSWKNKLIDKDNECNLEIYY